MKEKPIIFSTAMVMAILDGWKTQTRRICKKALFDGETWAGAVHKAAKSGWIAWYPGNVDPEFTKKAYDRGFHPPYQVGYRLWVKETWFNPDYEPGIFRHPHLTYYKEKDKTIEWKWKTARFMPKVYARIWLEVTEVRAERLQDITEDDSIAEGSQIPCAQLPKSCQQGTMTERTQFSRIWDSINGKKHPWDSNPWVWVIEFKPSEATRPQS